MRTKLLSSIVLLFTLACSSGGEAESTEPAPAAEDPKPAKLSLGKEIEGGCYDRPEAPYTPDNHAELALFVASGDKAPAFELKDLDGKSHSLEDLLKTKPVAILQGSYTCPVYRANRPKWDKLAERMGDKVHVVVVHGPEAHPEKDPSPYRGTANPKKYSEVDLATSYKQRVSFAKKVGDTPNVIELVEPLDNPFWCTYGTTPSGAYFIDQSGTIAFVHEFLDMKTFVASMKANMGR